MSQNEITVCITPRWFPSLRHQSCMLYTFSKAEDTDITEQGAGHHWIHTGETLTQTSDWLEQEKTWGQTASDLFASSDLASVSLLLGSTLRAWKIKITHRTEEWPKSGQMVKEKTTEVSKRASANQLPEIWENEPISIDVHRLSQTPMRLSEGSEGKRIWIFHFIWVLKQACCCVLCCKWIHGNKS